MNELLKLKELAKEFTVLYVEDSKILQKQVGTFLQKFFKNVYTAIDGMEGLDAFKKYQPDLILTDLTMPKMNGHDMIKSIKKIDSKIQIIVISAHADKESMQESIQMGVADFVPKPIDLEKLQQVLIHSLEILNVRESNKLSDAEKKILKKESELNNALELIKQHNIEVQFINHYKGVPIIHSGNIVSCEQDSIVIQAQYVQILAIEYEKGTVIECEFLPKDIEAKFISIENNNQISLSDLKYIDSSPKQREHVRLEPDDNFKMAIYKKHKKITSKLIDISSKAVSFNLEELPKDFKIGEELDLHLAFELSQSTLYHTLDHVSHLVCKGKILKIKKDNKKGYIAVALFNLPRNDEKLLEKYIYQRELELIEEFKKLSQSKR